MFLEMIFNVSNSNKKFPLTFVINFIILYFNSLICSYEGVFFPVGENFTGPYIEILKSAKCIIWNLYGFLIPDYSVFEEAALSYLPYIQFYATFDETVSRSLTPLLTW